MSVSIPLNKTECNAILIKILNLSLYIQCTQVTTQYDFNTYIEEQKAK